MLQSLKCSHLRQKLVVVDTDSGFVKILIFSSVKACCCSTHSGSFSKSSLTFEDIIFIKAKRMLFGAELSSRKQSTNDMTADDLFH